MASFSIFDGTSGTRQEISVDTFTSIVRGTCILKVVHDGFVELRLSEDIGLRFDIQERGQLSATLSPIAPVDGFPAVRVRIVKDGEQPTAMLVEKRLRSLRQIYAIAFLLHSNREGLLGKVLFGDPNGDLEEMLTNEEQLHLQAAGPGSWWVTVLSVVKGSGQKAIYAVGALYGEGRDLIIRKMTAEVEITETEAAKRKFELGKTKLDALIDLSNKAEDIKDPQLRDAVKERLIREMRQVDPTMLALPPPDVNK